MKLGLISLGGESSKLIAEEARQFFDEVEELSLKELRFYLEKSKAGITKGNEELAEFDALYLRGSHKYALLQRALTKTLHKQVYMPIKPHAFTLGHNKLLSLLELQQKGVPVPSSYFVPNAKEAKELLSTLHYPIIIKIPEGTQGKGVLFADSESSARSMIDALDVFKQPYIIQDYVETGLKKSQDIRVIVANGRVLGAMKRYSHSTDVRANIHASGTGTSFTPSPEVEKVAVKAARILGADVAAVDILEGREPLVIEVNLSPGLKGIMKYTGKNIAKDVAKALYEKTLEFKERNGSVENNTPKVEDSAYDEHYIEAHVDKGMLTLPRFVTKGSQLGNGDDLVVQLKKGEVKIFKHNISHDDE